jgi:short subunit dehydrogenase-like uncharacterized protein
MANRQFDLILLGATGYTGKLTAEYITSNLPTNLRWAVAGRNQSKLQSLIGDLKKLNSSRNAPEIITVANLTTPDLAPIVRKAKVVINTVGPYHLYSTPVVEACAQNGTHYLDVTGETPWVKDMITKYEDTAKKSGAIIIPEVGIESAPSDLVAYVATRLIRKVWDCGVMDMVAAVHELKSSGASGGTLASGIGLAENYSAKQLAQVLYDPFVLSPAKLKPYTKDTIYPPNPEPNTYIRTGMEKFTGVWKYPRLGNLTTSITAKPNEAIVHRSAGLTPYFYGFNFSYEEYMAVNSPLVGMIIHFAISLLTILLAFPPTRAFLKMFTTYAPGAGPTMESSKNDAFELRAIAVAEQLAKQPRKALATFRYEGGIYHLTALLVAEAAMVLIEKVEAVNGRHGAGFLTPACLGDEYVERLEKTGVKLDVKQLGDVGSK